MKSGLNKEREDDQDLINQIRRKNKKVFELLYKKYYKKLYVLSCQYVVNHEVAEEIVHDVFINIWKMSDQIIIQRSLERYLFRSIINASLNYMTNEKQMKGKRDEYSRGQNEAAEESVNVEDTEQVLIKLEGALDLLPPQCKKVMMLSRFEKLKQKKIAEQMGISIKTVKNHLSYGFNKIRVILDNKASNIMLFILMTIIHLDIIHS